MLRPTRLLFVGDSVTAGYGLAGAPAYPQLVAGRLADRGQMLDVEVDALDGSDSGYVLRRFERMVTAHDADWVVVSLGLNDARPPKGRDPRPPAEFAANVLALIDRIMSIGARPVFVTPTPRFDDGAFHADPTLVDRGSLLLPYAAALRDVTISLRTPLIDAYQAFLIEPQLAELIPDGVHPNARGHEMLADVVTEELLLLLDSDTTVPRSTAAR